MSSSFLATEKGTVRKKWKGKLPVALIYPNIYPLAVSNLGYQLVYSLLNSFDDLVCERFVYPSKGEPLRSLESSRPLKDFPVIFGSVSFEEDYPRFAALLKAGEVPPFVRQRERQVQAGQPLVILGGVGVIMNPEPLADFADIMVIGEAEPVLAPLVDTIIRHNAKGIYRQDFLTEAGKTIDGCYVPSRYSFTFAEHGKVIKVDHETGFPDRIIKVVAEESGTASHSMLLSPDAELGMYMTELGRGCSMGCRFCAAGFIYRPPRNWSDRTILNGLNHCPEDITRVGLLGMEMTGQEVLDRIAGYLQENDRSLSFSSLRADRISDQLLLLLSQSGLKSVAIAPDGCSERLRRVINKGLNEEDLLGAAEKLVSAGILNLKLYVMVGLPTETNADLDEMITLIKKLQQKILPIGQRRGRVTTMSLSVNSFVPKPWTPFQYVSFGGLGPAEAEIELDETKAVMALKQKIKYLRKGLAGVANLKIKVDRPERVLQQAVYARGDRRLAPVLLDVGAGESSFKQAMKKHGLTVWEYAIRPRSKEELFCWDIIDHGILKNYLWMEYRRGLAEKQTEPCNTLKCKRCGVCHENVSV